MKKFFSLFMALTFTAILSFVIGSVTALAVDNYSENGIDIPGTTFAVAAISFAFTVTMNVIAFKRGYRIPHRMAYTTPFTQGLCPFIQTALNNITRKNSPSLRRTPVGYVDALRSRENTAGFEQIPIDAGDGKIKEVRIKYKQPASRYDVYDTEKGNCDIDEYPSPIEKTVPLTKYARSQGIGFKESDFRKLCERGDQYMAETMMEQVNALMVNLNSKLIVTQSANFGAFMGTGGSSAAQSRQLLKVDGAADYFGEAQMRQDFRKADFNAVRPILIGDGNLSFYVDMQKIGCCNIGGQDVGRVAQFDYYYDSEVEAILGANHAIGLAPGMAQVLLRPRYKGEFRKFVPNLYEHGTFVDPFTGIEIDMEWEYRTCEKEYFMLLSVDFDLWNLPNDVYKAIDPRRGVNGTFHYNFTKASS